MTNALQGTAERTHEYGSSAPARREADRIGEGPSRSRAGDARNLLGLCAQCEVPIFGTDADAADSPVRRLTAAHRCGSSWTGWAAPTSRAAGRAGPIPLVLEADCGPPASPSIGAEQVRDTSRGIEWRAGSVARLQIREGWRSTGPLPSADEMAMFWNRGRRGAQLHPGPLRFAVDRASRASHLWALDGDRVASSCRYPRGVIAFPGVGKLGAIYTPIFSGYGADAVASRLADCEAKLLITADGFARRGKPVPMKATADQALDAAPSVERCLVVRRTGAAAAWNEQRDVWWGRGGGLRLRGAARVG